MQAIAHHPDHRTDGVLADHVPTTEGLPSAVPEPGGPPDSCRYAEPPPESTHAARTAAAERQRAYWLMSRH